MRKLLLFSALLISALTVNAQCLEDVGDFGNNNSIPMYNVTGTVEVTLNTDGTVTLDLGSDFMTAAGPDIRAFLVNSGGLSDGQLANTLIADLQHVEFGLVGSASVPQNGAKTFTIDIPAEDNIEDFDKVFFYCLQFDQFWDFGSYTPFVPSECGILSVESQDLESVQLYPNPARDFVEIAQNGDTSLQIAVYDVSGKLIAEETSSTQNQRLDVTNLVAGIYLVEMTTSEGNRRVQRLVVE